MRDYSLHVNDQKMNPIGVQYFYRNYVSKSIPLVLKNEAKNWKFIQNLDDAIKKGEKLEFLEVMFKSRVKSFDIDTVIGALIDYQRLTKDHDNFT